MGGPAELNLPDQAQRLLAQPASSQALLTLGLACHERMLQLGDDQRAAAIRHALAGAALFAAVRLQPEPPPDWLDAHEEHCCRQGAIWIHDLAVSETGAEEGWAGQAIKLLHRMEQLHPEPLPWAAVLRSELSRRAQPPSDQARPPLGSAILFTANIWEAGIRSELTDVPLVFGDVQHADLKAFRAVVPLNLADQHHINNLLAETPDVPALVPSEPCIALCHDKAAFSRHLRSLNLGDQITPSSDPGDFPWILKPRAGEFGVDTLILTSAEEAREHADKISSGLYTIEHYIAGHQECSTHLIASEGHLHFMGSVRFTFDSDHYVKGINKAPIAMERIDHSHLRPIFERILASLQYDGFGCFDYKMVNGQPCILELNPRYGASMTAFIAQSLPVYCELVRQRRRHT